MKSFSNLIKQAFVVTLICLTNTISAQQIKNLFEFVNTPINSLSIEQKDNFNRFVTNGKFVTGYFFVNLNDLEKIQNNGNLTVEFPNKKVAELIGKNVETFPNGFYWYGETKYNDNITANSNLYDIGTFSIRKSNDIYNGTFILDDDLYLLRTLGSNLYIIIKLEIGENGPSCLMNEPSNSILDKYYDIPYEKPALRNDRNCKVRVLALYTERARNFAGGNAQAENEILLSINNANQSFINSAISPNEITLEIVGVQLYNFPEFTETRNIPIKNELELNLIPLFQNTTSQLNILRENVNADIVVLFTDGNYSNGRDIGRAGTLVLEANSAISVVDFESANLDFLTAHEIGHLFSCRHQSTADNTGPFEHGFKFRA